jgi:hypothetical protein
MALTKARNNVGRTVVKTGNDLEITVKSIR